MVSKWIKGNKRELLVFLVSMILVLAMYFLARYAVIEYKDYKNHQVGFTSDNEFVNTINCAPEIDKYGVDRTYVIEFELKTAIPGQIYVHFQNGSDTRYGILQTIDSTTEYQKFSLEVIPEIVDLDVADAYLAFYGEYGTGVIPTVRRVSFRVKD